MEPAYTFDTAKVVGTPGGGFWSQIHTFFPQDKDKKEKRGDLLSVLVVSGSAEGVEAVAAGREILGRLHEEYYGNLEGSAFKRLSDTVARISKEYKGLEVVAASLLGRALFLAICGQGRVLLKRKGEIGEILGGEGSSADSGQALMESGQALMESGPALRTASGFLEEGDLLVLGSGQFFRTVGTGVLKAVLESNSAAETVETLAPIILGHENMANAAAVLALVKKTDEEAIRPMAVEDEAGAEQKFPEEKAASFFHKLFSCLKFPQSKFLFVRRAEKEKRKKVLFFVSLLFLGALLACLFLGLRGKAIEKGKSQIKQIVQLAEEKFNQGKALSITKPEEGKILIQEAKKLVDGGLALKKNDETLLLLGQKMEDFLASSGQEILLSDASLFMDLNLISDEAGGVSFVLKDKNLIILDQKKGKIYFLDIEKKSYETIDYPGKDGRLISSLEKTFVFDSKGIYEILTDKTVSLRVSQDSGWKEVAGFSTFGGNLYLLDKGSNAVWRYTATALGFSSKKNWFLSSPDLSSAASLAIDGSVWILKKDGISKFTFGKEDSFSLSKMPEVFSEPIKIYTTAELENLYVLDRARKKIFVIAKDGGFKTSYSWEGLKDAVDLIAVEPANKIFVLTGSKIYDIGAR